MPFFHAPASFPSEAALLQALFAELNVDSPKAAQPQPQQPQQPQQQPQQQQMPACFARRQHRPQPYTFTPRFDVTESADAYELFGELPGLEQRDINIEFSDAQTIVIKGVVRRGLPSTTAAQPKEENNKEEAEVKDDNASEKSSHAATVEDDYDEADTPLITPSSTSSSTVAGPSSAEKGKQVESQAQAPVREVAKPKYWVAERRVGEFARSFTFEQRVEQDFVTATLRAGVLTVVVPKSLKSRRVEVSVL